METELWVEDVIEITKIGKLVLPGTLVLVLCYAILWQTFELQWSW